MRSKYSIRFFLRGKYVTARITFASNRYEYSTYVVSDPDEWDKKSMRLKDSAKESYSKNRMLSHIVHTADIFFEKMAVVENRFPDRDELHAMMMEATGRYSESRNTSKRTYMDSVISRFVREQSQERCWSESTIKKMNTILNHMYGFKKNICLEDFTDESIFHRFVSYLYSIGIRNVTMRKYMKLLKWIFNWCNRNEIITETIKVPDMKFKGTEYDFKEVVYLEPDELMKFYDFRFSSKHLDNVRDVFCFCCFTGLRYSDVKKMKWSDIHEGHVDVVTKKTGERIRVELNKYSRGILERHNYGNERAGYALPVISNQRMNVYLKDAAREAGLDRIQDISYYIKNEYVELKKPLHEVITTHCARRTFVVIAMYLGIDVTVIMKWTGHSDIKAMAPYMEIMDRKKQNEMKKFDNL